MAKKKEEGRLELICFNDNTFDVRVEGEKSLLTCAMGTALLDRNEDNAFATITHDAIKMVVFHYEQEKKKPVVKKAKTSKKAATKKSAKKAV
jgi:hypothetical protein